MYRYIAIPITLLCLGIGALLFTTQNNMLILYGLLDERKETEKIGSKWLNLLPKHLAIWKAQATEHSCFAQYGESQINLVSKVYV